MKSNLQIKSQILVVCVCAVVPRRMSNFSDSDKMQACSSKMIEDGGSELAGHLTPLSISCKSSTHSDMDDEYYQNDDEEVYEDANDDDSTVLQSIDLEQSFQDCDKAIKKFFNNDLTGAMAIMKPWYRTSLYHSLGLSIFEFIPAMLTFDSVQIQKAITAIKNCVALCNKNRKRYTFVESIGSIMKKPNYALYTDLEAHAELCFAEALLLQAALTVIEGEDLTGLIKGTFKVKSCYNSYQNCYDIKEIKAWDSTESRIHFKSGVRLGTATFNLMISQLPPRVVALLEFVGFHGNKYYGLSELEKGSRSPGMRAVLCDLTLLAYHLVICQFIGVPGDMKQCNMLLEKSLKNYPDSVWFLAFRARFEYLQGHLDNGIQIYNRAIHAQDTFRQFRLLCYWELMWVHGLKLNFLESAMYADKLIEENAWSKTTHSYIKAAMMLQAGGTELNHSQLMVVNDLIRNAAFYKIRIAGKSLPMEKFVIRRCARFEAQRGHLLLPGLEIMCLWNLFPILTGDNKPLLQDILRLIERTGEVMSDSSCEWMGSYDSDNKALLHFLAGCTLSALEVPRLAIDEFKKVIKLKRDIKEDAFLVPFSVCEMAMCHFQLGDPDTTLALLNEAKKKYSGYNLESRLHFRVHARIQMVKEQVGHASAKYLMKFNENEL